VETLTSNVFKDIHSAFPYFNEDGVLELFVRFKGPADGHVVLLSNQNASDVDNRYIVSLKNSINLIVYWVQTTGLKDFTVVSQIGIGSYNNKISEIRRDKPEKLEFKLNTPGILSAYQYRGFVIRYNPSEGGVSVFAEGSDLPLLHLIDPNPLQIKFFGFATWHNRITQAAFDCRAKDDHSSVARRISDQAYPRTANGSKSGNYLFIYIWLILLQK